VLDLTESANLYLTPQQGRQYEAVLANHHYQESIAVPLARGVAMLPNLLRSVACIDDREPFTVIDCGPATADESVRKLRSLGQVVAVTRYVVVDVNSRLLSNVKAGVIQALKVPVTTLQLRFEELDSAALNQYIDGKSVLLFGSTGMNYEHFELIRLLRRLCASGTFVCLESLLQNGSTFPDGYDSAAVSQFAFGPLSLLGASSRQFDFRAVAGRDRVRIEFIARRTVQLCHPDVSLLRRGDRVWTAFSRRPTLIEHQQEISKIARHFDTFVWRNRMAVSIGQFI
jgi:hypothetical protein